MLVLESIYAAQIYPLFIRYQCLTRLAGLYENTAGSILRGSVFLPSTPGPTSPHFAVSCSEINLTFTVNNKDVNRREASDFP